MVTDCLVKLLTMERSSGIVRDTHGGRLFAKEMFNCIDKKLFEDKCMDENNEICKFLKGLDINLIPQQLLAKH